MKENGAIIDKRAENDFSDFPTKPLNAYVIIKPFPADEISSGGIFIPDSAKERPSKAWLVAMGEDLKDKIAKVGDVVHHVKGAGTLMQYEGQDYYIMRYTDLLCKD